MPYPLPLNNHLVNPVQRFADAVELVGLILGLGGGDVGGIFIGGMVGGVAGDA